MVYLNEFNWTLDDHLTALVLIILCFKFESCLMGDQNPSRQEKKRNCFIVSNRWQETSIAPSSACLIRFAFFF